MNIYCLIFLLAVSPLSLANADSQDLWAALASGQVTSPALADAPGDVERVWTAPDNRSVKLVIKAPRPSANAPTVTLGAVPADADARPYFESLVRLAKCKTENNASIPDCVPAGVIKIPAGTYTFNSTAGVANNLTHWSIDQLSDVTIDGSGATLVFAEDAIGIKLSNCQRVRLNNFKFKSSLRIASMGQILMQGGEKVFRVNLAYPVGNTNHKLETITEVVRSPEGDLQYKIGGQRLTVQSGGMAYPTYIGNQTYTSPSFASLKLSSFYIVSHYYGVSPVIYVYDFGARNSEDITLSNLTFHSGPGMGILARALKRGLYIYNNVFIRENESALMSTARDAVHLQDNGGDIIVFNNTFFHMGDDAINIGALSKYVSAIRDEGKTVDLYNDGHGNWSGMIHRGDVLAFFNAANEYLGQAVVSLDTLRPIVRSADGMTYTVPLDQAVAGLTSRSIAVNTTLSSSRYYVSTNEVANCNCHGAQVSVPNGMIANNNIHDTRYFGLNLMTMPTPWQQGLGALNVHVYSNRLTRTGHGTLPLPLPGAINVFGWVESGVASAASNIKLAINGNTIEGAQDACISVASGRHVTIHNNRCVNTNLGPVGTGKASILVAKSRGVTIQGNSRAGTTTGPISVDQPSVEDVQIQPTY